jgi:hypothetical protein
MDDFSHTEITELAVIVVQHLQNHGIEVVLVGGLAVEIYTENLYLTEDIDLVNTNYQAPKHLRAAMADLGFTKQGRVFINPTTSISVEFPAAPLAVGNQLIKKTAIVKTARGSIPILRIDDVIKDRLAAFIHWRDHQSLVQAVVLMFKNDFKHTKFKSFCEVEGELAHYTLLSELFKAAKNKKAENMHDVELLLSALLLENI